MTIQGKGFALGEGHSPDGGPGTMEEPLPDGPRCPQCRKSDYLKRDYAWNGERVKCKWCGLGGMEPHFAGIEDMDAYFAGWEDEHG